MRPTWAWVQDQARAAQGGSGRRPAAKQPWRPSGPWQRPCSSRSATSMRRRWPGMQPSRQWAQLRRHRHAVRVFILRRLILTDDLGRSSMARMRSLFPCALSPDISKTKVPSARYIGNGACAGGSTQHALAALERLALAGSPQAVESQADSVTTNGGPPPKKQHRADKPPPGESTAHPATMDALQPRQYAASARSWCLVPARAPEISVSHFTAMSGRPVLTESHTPWLARITWSSCLLDR